ncbi:MAG: type II secretion system protein [Candidatus Omnitrophota bacterium]
MKKGLTRQFFLWRKTGFTLLELMIVVVIIAILATFALPRYFRGVEKHRAAEGVMMIQVLRAAQISYFDEHRQYQDFVAWNDAGDLLMDVPAPKFFVWSPADPNGSFLPGAVATAQRNNLNNSEFGNYNLKITENGAIYCWGGSSADTCRHLGFTVE